MGRTANGHVVSLSDDNNVLELGGGNGHTIL